MNLLFAMPWDQSEGGVTHVAASLAHSMEARGHKVCFLFPGEAWALRSGTSRRGFDARWCRFRNYPAYDAHARARLSWLSTVCVSLPQLVRFCRRQQIELINIHYPGSGFALLVDVAQRTGVPLVVSVHGSDVLRDRETSPDAGQLRMLAHASQVIAPSHAFLKSVVNLFPALGSKACCIYNGFDEDELKSCPAPSDPGSHSPVALCIAAHTQKKGIDVLLRAVRSSAASQMCLRLVGDGPLRRDLEDLTARLGLTGRVTFLGSIDRRRVFEELHRCDFLIMPSRHASESFGLAALEAMACGKPVIASSVGGLCELVGHEVTGLLVPPDDPEALAQALTRMSRQPDLRERLGASARKKSLGFTTRSTADQYESLFRRLIEGRTCTCP